MRITGPAGELNSAAFQVAALSDRSFRVTGFTLSDEGEYVVEIGPDVTDLSSNPLSGAYAAALTIDTTGPRITALTPAGTVHGTVNFVDVTFDSEFNGGTFRAEDVTLTGPDGAVAVNHPVRVSGNTWRIGFGLPEPGRMERRVTDLIDSTNRPGRPREKERIAPTDGTADPLNQAAHRHTCTGS